MFSSFKNIELFRYFVRVDLNKGIEKIIKKNDDNFSLIAGSIFSGSFSILGTYFGLHEVQYSNICKIFLATTLFALLFVIGMYLFKSFRWFIKYVKNCGKREKLPSKAEIKEYIDEFDHIACDNILICQNFIRAYSNKKTSDDLKEFYFYEIIYYAKVSVAIIHKIIANKQVCINDEYSRLSRATCPVFESHPS